MLTSNCQKRHCGCRMYQKKEEYRVALRNTNLPNPMEKWECSADEEKTCLDFQPFPPRMTEEQFNEEQTQILSRVPIEFQSAISCKAWNDGHAYGYEEVISTLIALVDVFEEPIKKYAQRVVSQNISKTPTNLS